MNAAAFFPAAPEPAPDSSPDNPVAIDFIIGSRRLLSVPRRLATWSFSLEQALSGDPADTPPPQAGPDGFRVLSAPLPLIPAITAQFPGHLIGARQDYPRHYIAMSGSFTDYMARFSGKTRSTLRRKARKLESEVGPRLAITEHRTLAEVERFLERAAPLSAMTYQARLLDAGLPDDPAARRTMLTLAEADRIRCFLLEASEGPIAYLALPVHGSTLVYAHLGYDPQWARLSPGTVLQMHALERLFAEQRFTHFDFTEGDGAHKAMFGTDQIECASFALLTPTLANRSLITARRLFDASTAGAKGLAARSGALGRIRSALRA
ncbi:MAG: GNAT family N-acetyltransferase [Pseudomonadota bacterium]